VEYLKLVVKPRAAEQGPWKTFYKAAQQVLNLGK
jgi:hypothetical protein